MFFRFNFYTIFSILAEIDQIKEKTSNWDELSQKEQDRIIDKNFVPREVRKQYAEKNSTREWGKFLPFMNLARILETN